MIQAAVQAAMPEIIERLRREMQPLAAYHFGSSARGAAGADSDVDLVVVVEHSPLSFIDRSVKAYRALRSLGLPVDVQVYTRKEFETRADLPVSFERSVRDEGRLIYAA